MESSQVFSLNQKKRTIKRQGLEGVNLQKPEEGGEFNQGAIPGEKNRPTRPSET